MPEGQDVRHVGTALGGLREALGVGLREHARLMGVSHTRVGRVENQPADLRLGTITSYVQALGAELTLTVTMPDGEVVDLLQPAPRRPR